MVEGEADGLSQTTLRSPLGPQGGARSPRGGVKPAQRNRNAEADVGFTPLPHLEDIEVNLAEGELDELSGSGGCVSGRG